MRTMRFMRKKSIIASVLYFTLACTIRSVQCPCHSVGLKLVTLAVFSSHQGCELSQSSASHSADFSLHWLSQDEVGSNAAGPGLDSLSSQGPAEVRLHCSTEESGRGPSGRSTAMARSMTRFVVA